MFLGYLTVGEDQNVSTTLDRVFGFGSQGSQAGFNPFLTPGERIGDIQFVGAELVSGELLDIADLIHLLGRENRLGHF